MATKKFKISYRAGGHTHTLEMTGCTEQSAINFMVNVWGIKFTDIVNIISWPVKDK